jgi:hypothetical protein
MKRLITLLLLACLGIAGLPAAAADRLDGVLALVTDDKAALDKIRGTPERHVMIYFGNFQH